MEIFAENVVYFIFLINHYQTNEQCNTWKTQLHEKKRKLTTNQDKRVS